MEHGIYDDATQSDNLTKKEPLNRENEDSDSDMEGAFDYFLKRDFKETYSKLGLVSPDTFTIDLNDDSGYSTGKS